MSKKDVINTTAEEVMDEQKEAETTSKTEEAPVKAHPVKAFFGKLGGFAKSTVGKVVIIGGVACAIVGGVIYVIGKVASENEDAGTTGAEADSFGGLVTDGNSDYIQLDAGVEAEQTIE